MSKKHKARVHEWNNGVLETVEYRFASFQDALAFVENFGHQVAKIFDEDDQLVYSIKNSPATNSTYA